MQIKAEEISQIIEGQIKNYEKKVEMSETGVVLSVGDGIARVLRMRECDGHGAPRVPRRRHGNGPEP